MLTTTTVNPQEVDQVRLPVEQKPIVISFLFILNLKRNKNDKSERMFSIFKINISRIKDFEAARNEKQKRKTCLEKK